MGKNGSLRGKRGFSLIELLVVIAIIAIMAAILFPVIVSAKQNSKRSACLCNQRQVGIGYCLYADDNQGTFPYVSPTTTRQIFPTYPTSAYQITTISGELIVRLGPYVKNKRMFYCTAADAYGKGVYTYKKQIKANPPFMFIGYYNYCSTEWAGTDPVKQSGNSKRILLSCLGGGNNDLGWSGHGKAQCVYTFADGHVKYIKHFMYPYSYWECKNNLHDMNMLLMPRWND